MNPNTRWSGNASHRRPAPSPREISAVASEIRENWSLDERRRRRDRAELSQWTLLGRLHGASALTI
jgi:hypothetical protein